MFNTLPRDIQLAIIQRFDMDTRIKCGLIFKLHVPTHIKEKLEKVVVPTSPKTMPNGDVMFYQRTLGSRQAVGHHPGVYMMRLYDDSCKYRPKRGNNKVEYKVLHIESDGQLSLYETFNNTPWILTGRC